MSGKRPTLADVASRAGTSTAVVSYVLNNGPRPVSESLRAKVIDAIDALDKLPSSILDAIDNAADGHRRKVDAMINLTEEGLGFIQRQNIRDHYEIEEFVIPAHGDSERIFQFIAAECDWEEEQGMEILLCDAQVVSCTDQDCLYLDEAWAAYLK